MCFLAFPLVDFAQNVQFPATSSQQQRMTDEILANEFMSTEEFDKAIVIYKKLFVQFNTQYYFTNYVHCLIRLNRLEEAEQIVKKQLKGNNNDVQLSIELANIYRLMGDEKKATKQFNKIIEELPADKNLISITANAFKSKNLDDYALKVYEKGSQMSSVNYPFYLEKANLYQTTGNLSKSIDFYLQHLDFQPEHYELVKNRFQVLLMSDANNDVSDMLRTKLLTKAQAEPENENIYKLLIWFSLQQKDFELAMMQSIAIDRKLGDREVMIIDLANICLANQQYETALKGFGYIEKKGTKSAYYFYGLSGELKSRYYIADTQHNTDIKYYLSLSKDIETGFETMGFNRETWDLAIIQSQIFAYKLNRPDDAAAYLEKALTLPLQPNEIAEIKMYLADILLFKNDVWEATLLYSQIEKSLKNEPLAHEAKFRNARLRYFIGEYNWSVTMLDVLKAATSKLIANDALSLSMLIHDFLLEDTLGLSLTAFAHADLLIYQHKESEASTILDTLMNDMKSAALLPYFLMRKAEISDDLGQYHLADSLYRQVYTRFTECYQADDAILHCAMLNETKLNQTAEAQTLYELLFQNYPSSIFANEARRKYRLLRGDVL